MCFQAMISFGNIKVGTIFLDGVYKFSLFFTDFVGALAFLIAQIHRYTDKVLLKKAVC